MHLTGISTAVVVTIAAVVAGPLFAPTPASAADPAPVATGQCATLTYAQITEKSLPDDLASIPCDQLHTFEVTGVFTVPDHLAAQGWDSTAVSALLATKCEVLSTTYQPQRLGWNMPNRAFSGVAFRPTQPQWDAGARWYVCGGTGYDANYQDVHAYRGARRQLRATARLIETQGFRTVIVAGYSARYGRSSPSYRRLISQRRADLTTAFLRDRLPAGVRFTSHGFGARHPVASNNTAKGRAQNRRAVVSVR